LSNIYPPDSACIAIGKAVIAAQMLETVLIPVFEVFRIHTESGHLEKTGGYITEGAWKVPVRNIVKRLSERGSLAPDFEQRINALMENRHELVHRWFQKNGSTDESAPLGVARLINLATSVEAEALELMRMLAGYMVKYANPEWSASNMAEYRQRMVEIFQRAHLDFDPAQ